MKIKKRYTALAEFMRDARLAAGKTQRQLAKCLRYSTPQFISNWERGIAPVPLDHIKKIARILKWTDQDKKNFSLILLKCHNEALEEKLKKEGML